MTQMIKNSEMLQIQSHACELLQILLAVPIIRKEAVELGIDGDLAICEQTPQLQRALKAMKENPTQDEKFEYVSLPRPKVNEQLKANTENGELGGVSYQLC